MRRPPNARPPPPPYPAPTPCSPPPPPPRHPAEPSPACRQPPPPPNTNPLPDKGPVKPPELTLGMCICAANLAHNEDVSVCGVPCACEVRSRRGRLRVSWGNAWDGPLCKMTVASKYTRYRTADRGARLLPHLATVLLHGARCAMNLMWTATASMHRGELPVLAPKSSINGRTQYRTERPGTSEANESAEAVLNAWIPSLPEAAAQGQQQPRSLQCRHYPRHP